MCVCVCEKTLRHDAMTECDAVIYLTSMETNRPWSPRRKHTLIKMIMYAMCVFTFHVFDKVLTLFFFLSWWWGEKRLVLPELELSHVSVFVARSAASPVTHTEWLIQPLFRMHPPAQTGFRGELTASDSSLARSIYLCHTKFQRVTNDEALVNKPWMIPDRLC